MNLPGAIRRRNAARAKLERAEEVVATCEAALLQARIEAERARDALVAAEDAITRVLWGADKVERKRRGAKKAARLLHELDKTRAAIPPED